MSSPGRRPPGGKMAGLAAVLPLAACCLLLAAFGHGAEQPSKPAEPGKTDSAVQPAADNPARRGLDGLKLPADSIIVITDEAKDALRLLPRGFVLSPEKYQELMDELARLRAQPRPEKPATPTDCRLTGRAEGDLARLRAAFKFKTDRRNTLVTLACAQGHPTAVLLDGQVPVLLHTADGYVLQVDEPGPHEAILDLDVPVTGRGTGGSFRGFTLDLPRAAVTTLGLDLPPAVKEVRVGRTAMTTQPAEDKKTSRLETPGLGPVEQLDLTWKGPALRPVGPPLLTAEGQITVQVEGAVVRTVAEITLDAIRGQASQWQLQVPPQAVVRLKTPGADERAPATIEPTDPKGTLQTIRLKEPSADPLVVVVELEQPRGPVAVGPFYVLGAFRQRGTILVAAPPDARLRFVPRGEVSPRELTPADSRRDFKPVAAFSYWNLPAPSKPQGQPPPLLQLEFETAKGAIETEVDHTITLTGRGWQALTRFSVTPPLRGEVRELALELPPEYQREERLRPEEPVQEVQVNAATRLALVTLTDRQFKPFTVTLEGTYPPPAAGDRQASLELPRLKADQGLDRGGKVTVVLPADLELLPPGASREPAAPETLHRHTWTFERMPERIDIHWRPYRPDLPVDAIVDVTLSGNQAVIRHRLWAPAPQTLPKQLPIQVPEALADSVQVVERGKPASGEWKGPARTVEVTDATSRTGPLVLKYFFPLPRAEEDAAGPRTFAVPLVVPAQATRGNVRVRVWSDPGTVPQLAGGPWEEGPIEVVEDQDRLPDLCLRGTRPDLPLTLRLSETDSAPQATVLVERALIRATVLQAGQHNYWASFRLSRLRAPHLDIELPAAPSGLGLKTYLDGRLLKWWPVEGAGADTARLVRLKISPELVSRPAVLDIIYQIAPNQPAARSSGYALGQVAVQTTLYAPLLRGSGDHVQTRWDVRLPANWVPLLTGGGFPFEQRWGWRGWLLAPQPAVTSAELQRWFAGDSAARTAPDVAEVTPDSEAERGPPSVVCWRTDLGPLRLSHAPQQAWLLACSLGLLAVGLGLYFLLVQRGRYGVAVALLGIVAALLGLLWPNVLAVVFYGCQPGLVVLLVIFGCLWLLQRRYRRQVVFLPGFTRVKSGSSLIRSGASKRRGEPTTVDVGPVVTDGSSQRRRADGRADLPDDGGGQEPA